jgi:ATP-binding cassette subfamily B (MDR/TAP) protein 1
MAICPLIAVAQGIQKTLIMKQMMGEADGNNDA